MWSGWTDPGEAGSCTTQPMGGSSGSSHRWGGWWRVWAAAAVRQGICELGEATYDLPPNRTHNYHTAKTRQCQAEAAAHLGGGGMGGGRGEGRGGGGEGGEGGGGGLKTTGEGTGTGTGDGEGTTGEGEGDGTGTGEGDGEGTGTGEGEGTGTGTGTGLGEGLGCSAHRGRDGGSEQSAHSVFISVTRRSCFHKTTWHLGYGRR